MAETVLTIATSDLKRAFGLYVGYGRDSSDWTADELADFNAALEAALRQAYFPIRANGTTHKWSFMYPEAPPLVTNAPYSTGTIVIVAGVVTLTGGTWPSWAAAGRLKVLGNVYTVATRNSNTVLTLDDLTVAVASGTAFQLGQAYYDLPDDFLDFDSPLTYQPGVSTYYPAIEIYDEQMLRIKQQSHEYFHRPLWGALVPVNLDPEVGQRWQIFLAPTPDASYRFSYRYQRAPGGLDDTDIYHWGGVPFSELIRLSLLSKAEEFLNDGQTIMQQRFLLALEAAIDYDKKQNAPEHLGYNGDGPAYSTLPQRYANRDIAYFEDINYVPL
jgi:hypothetical protein